MKQRGFVLLSLLIVLITLIMQRKTTEETITVKTVVTSQVEYVPRAEENRFNQNCQWWVNEFKRWRKNIEKNKNAPEFTALQIRSGTGDRLAGILGALNHAMERKQRLRIVWPLLDQIFEISSASKGIVSLESDASNISYNCSQSSFFNCDYRRHVLDNCPIYNRACLPKKRCVSLSNSVLENFSMRHVLGCPLRAILKVKADFYQFRVSWFMNKESKTGTLSEFFTYLENYHLIALHLRIGDKALSKRMNKAKKKKIESMMLDRSKDCLHLVENNYREEKEVKYIVATDDEEIKDYFRTHFASKVIILQMKAKHIEKLEKEGEFNELMDMKKMFSEWLLLSKADELITNNAHSFGISSFSRFAWLFSLRSSYYEVSRKKGDENKLCKPTNLKYEGNCRPIYRACKNRN